MSSYYDFRKSVEENQKNMSKDEVIELMSKHEEVLADLDNFAPIKHNWVERGLVMSCEGAGHDNHRHFKRLPDTTA